MPARSKSIRQAEKRALEGTNESQDSQELMDAYMKSIGIGILSSSPVAAQPFPLPLPLPVPIPVPTQRKSKKSQPQPPPKRTASHEEASSLVETQDTTRHVSLPDQTRAPTQTYAQGSEVSDPNDVLGLVDDDDIATRVDVPTTKKMDSSQQSPTQSNHGRSYEQYLPTSSPGRAALPNDDSQSSDKRARGSSHDEKTLLEHDIGAVNFNFDHLAAIGQTDSSNRTRLRGLGSQHQTPPLEFPETPAPLQNPFRHSRSQLLPPSQLFHQFSSAVKHLSPTSSRPSPNDFTHNSISPNPIISSPLKARGLRSTPIADPTSSPLILPGTTSSGFRDRAESPVDTASSKTRVVPDSPYRDHRKKSVQEPNAHYEPMRKSQERRSTSEARSGEDDDDNDSIKRKMKVKSRKEAALRQLTAISFAPPLKSDDIEVPSTNKGRPTTPTEEPSDEHGPEDEQAPTQDIVADSQVHGLNPVQDQLLNDQDSTQSDLDQTQELDAAEPMPKAAQEPPRTLPSPSTKVKRPLAGVETSSADAIPETSQARKTSQAQMTSKAHTDNGIPQSDLPLPKAKSTPVFKSSPPALSTRSRKTTTTSPRGAVTGSASTLSNLASTPSLSSGTTPATENSELTNPTIDITAASNSSPAVAKNQRREANGNLPRLKSRSTESLRQSSRLGLRPPSSADELSRSQSATPTFDQSLLGSRASIFKTSRTSTKAQQSHRGPLLFEGMAFAISFQARKTGETKDQFKGRMGYAATIEKRIKQAGGKILHNGFDELFEALPVKTIPDSPISGLRTEPDLSLSETGGATGFTALIADGHSRKVKYMQALALGLPCIASRWVTSCLDKNDLVDWIPYLLCAGQSAFLGDAIRSRNLSPYEASTAQLTNVISQRTKLLEGSKILLVMKKSVEAKKMAYVFLARVLGALLYRVYSIEEARVEMKAAEDSGRPFDWVYVDGKSSDHGGLFSTATGADGKKRKRASTAASGPPPKKIRTLSDELVIQSLILGRLIEEGEMEEY
ncbi:hypothetical protein B0T19DRAFT_164318 [Cercophora scortea]|uniref:BRCT domain-containing protein n=1 Tax=Cercophora scortea TaxID=314031 RepID=A0AAE0IM17_9PEZI|nr:hypothetical protein B0T19DRAFT_164318 [Cercophora scortea]